MKIYFEKISGFKEFHKPLRWGRGSRGYVLEGYSPTHISPVDDVVYYFYKEGVCCIYTLYDEETFIVCETSNIVEEGQMLSEENMVDDFLYRYKNELTYKEIFEILPLM